jgi:inactive STAND
MASFDLLQPRRDALQAEYDLLSEKLLKLRRAYAIDSGASVQFQLEKEIEQVEADLAKIGQQLEDLERLSGDGRLYQALLKLGYRKQVQTFRKFVQGWPVSAFLIHGGMEYGQRWLLNRLVVQHTQDSIAGKVIRINLTRVARRSDVAGVGQSGGGRSAGDDSRNCRSGVSVVADLSGAEKYSTQKLNTVIRENSILSANSAFFFKEADAGGGLA